MNFPQVHGARIRPLPDPELAEAEARLAALDDDELVAARPEWIEETVAKVAGRAPEVRGGRLRRAAAAAVAFFALHGFATAATVTAVSAVAVTAVVLWPEGRNSIDTLDYGEALGLLASAHAKDEDRTAALLTASIRMRRVIEVLQSISRDASISGPLHALAGQSLTTLAEDLLGPPQEPIRDYLDPFAGTLVDLQRGDRDPEVRRLAMLACVESVRAGIQQLRAMPVATESLLRSRDVALKRLSRLVTN